MKLIADENARIACPMDTALTLMAAKWTVEIMRQVAIRPTRTRQFLVHIPGLSMKSLLQQLKRLEAFGAIKRTQYDGPPVRVEYTITDRGRKLCELFSFIHEFSSEGTETRCGCLSEHQAKLTALN